MRSPCCVYIPSQFLKAPIITRQRFGKHVFVVTNTHVGRKVFYAVRSRRIKAKLGMVGFSDKMASYESPAHEPRTTVEQSSVVLYS
jgi:hypothetical protein